MSSLTLSLMKIAAGVAVLIGLAGTAGAADDSPASRDVAPTGSLRVAIIVTTPGPIKSKSTDTLTLHVQSGVGSEGIATRDEASGEVHGVTVELAKAAAAKLNLPLQIVQYRDEGQIALAAEKDAWDISFFEHFAWERLDPERGVQDRRFVDEGPLYQARESTYLVRAGSEIHTIADVDRAGVRVGSFSGWVISGVAARSLKQATFTTFDDTDSAIEALKEGRLDALAWPYDDFGSAPGAINLAKRLPGTRVLDEPVQAASLGWFVVVPKNRGAALDWVTHFIEDAKADGTVRRALDSAGFSNSRVASPTHRETK
jgi:polar amino acid transport system substrate-binding protein